MPYSSNSLSALTIATSLQDAPWYSAHVLVQFFNYLQTIDMSSQTSRFNGLTALRALVSTPPYVIVDGDPAHPLPIRFSSVTPLGVPNSAALFACRNFADWDSIFTTLQATLTAPPCFFYQLDPAVPAFYSALDAYQHALTTSYGIFNYVNFETTFSLHWS
jgi:hypothetical protein